MTFTHLSSRSRSPSLNADLQYWAHHGTGGRVADEHRDAAGDHLIVVFYHHVGFDVVDDEDDNVEDDDDVEDDVEDDGENVEDD